MSGWVRRNDGFVDAYEAAGFLRRTPVSEVERRIFEAHGDRVVLVSYGGRVSSRSTFACGVSPDHPVWDAITSSVVRAKTPSGCPACARSAPSKSEAPARVEREYRTWCRECDEDFVYVGTGTPKYCSARCKSAATRRQGAERQRRFREKHAAHAAAAPMATSSPRTQTETDLLASAGVTQTNNPEGN